MTNPRALALITLLTGLLTLPLTSQTVSTFEGIDASQVPKPALNVDPNGAIGTKQFMEYTNVYFQAYDKVTHAPVWSQPQSAISPWQNNGIGSCNDMVNDAMIIFDRLALRWVIAGHTSVSNNYNYCIAVSNTDDLSSSSLAWYTYVIPLDSYLGTNAQGQTYFPDWPKIATWPDAYYLSIDLNDLNLNFREVGVLVCALDRTDMLVNGTANPPICFKEMSSPATSVYLAHSLIPADVEGTTAPPSGRDEFFTSIQNPVLGNGSITSSTFNLWDFHVDWANPTSSTFTQSSITEAPYQPGCYTVGSPVDTICVPEPSSSSTHEYIDSVGDRFMPRMSYRNFGGYESFLVSHTVQVSKSSQQTGIRWYELRDGGSGAPSLYQDGTISPDTTTYRFIPSIAEDANGNAAAGYSISSSTTHPGMNASYFSLTNPTAPTEITLFDGQGDEENSWHMGSYTSMTVDPENGCTFWYVDQYYPTNQSGLQISWGTRIANFAVPGCGNPTLSPGSVTFAKQAVGVTSAPQTITLINSQQATLNISSILFTGVDPADFAQTNNCGASLAAGSTCSINVTFTPGAVGTRTAILNVNDDGSNTPQTASLTGTGVAAVSLSSTSINFGSVYLGSNSTANPVTLTNNQNVALTNINISISGSTAYSQQNTCGTSIPALGTCTITVTFAPTTTGAQTGTVNIADSASNSPQTISLTGSGAAPLNLSPASLNFGQQAVGTTSAGKVITVTNKEKVTVNFTSITITGADPADFAQTNNCSSLAPGAACAVTVTFTPQAKGSRTASLQLTDTATNSPQTAKLSGTGTT
ncbi:MAG TPA: choice-of-anchor D domain-containing protein [Candidatus Binatia bacterium]|nr:choice-of-anchor D domain-containing protein [Candidatus Binatia bacterium]